MKKGITLVAAIAAVLAVTSGAFAARNHVISASSQIKDGAISILDLSPNARKALKGQKGAKGARGQKGETGATGAQGPIGLTGAQGPQGLPGQALIADEWTAPNPLYDFGSGPLRVVDVPTIADVSGGPVDENDGVEMTANVQLDEGTYLVSSVAQFFDITTLCDGDAYPVVKMFVDGAWAGDQLGPRCPGRRQQRLAGNRDDRHHGRRGWRRAPHACGYPCR